MVLKKLKKLRPKDYLKAGIVGTSVATFGTMLAGFLEGVLGFIPSWGGDVIGISLPHGVLGVTIVTILITLIAEKYM